MREHKNFKVLVPSFGHLSDLFASLPVQVRGYCDKVVGRLQKGESVSLIMDSSGFRFDKASDWYETKYCKACENKPWRKLHLSMDADMEIYAVELTEQDVGDREILDLLMPKSITTDKVIADGGYYSAEKSQDLYEKGITPVIKRCIGSSLKTIKIESQKREAITIGNILNLWNSFGKPITVKIP